MNTATTEDGRIAPWDWIKRLGGRRRRYRVSAADRALICAQGKALTLLLTALQARGHIQVAEFADMLGVFSVVVAEDDDIEGDILAVWAGIMKQSL